MHTHLFPAKLAALFEALDSQGVLEFLRATTSVTVDAPDDDLQRIWLSSPELKRELEKLTHAAKVRIRLAYPDLRAANADLSRTQLEAYGFDGSLIFGPVRLAELEDGLANAVQVELMRELLRAQGVRIPAL